MKRFIASAIMPLFLGIALFGILFAISVHYPTTARFLSFGFTLFLMYGWKD